MTVIDHEFSNWIWRTEEKVRPQTVVFDVDGVISDASQRQHYLRAGKRDWDGFFSAVGQDEVIEDVAALLHILSSEHAIVLLTARPMRVQPQTLEWLERTELHWDCLIMRDFGDYTVSGNFKSETVDQLRSRDMDLRLAFEDDKQNVEMFRTQGVPCIYIHSGYYE